MEKKNTYIDLFAGCGGLSLGLYNSGWKGLFAIEKSPDAFETLKFNLIDKNNHFDWPEWLEIKEHDIYDLLGNFRSQIEKLKDKVDMVAGGPPCQGFSTAGKRSRSDERNRLVKAYLEIIKIIKPKIVFIENVRGFDIGFKKGDIERGKPFSDIVIRSLKKLGYKYSQKFLIDFSEFGIPQKRKRIIIIATMNNTANKFYEFLEEKKENFFQNKKITTDIKLEEAISDLLKQNGSINSQDSKGFKAGIYINSNLTNYQKFMRQKCSLEFPNSHRFVNHRKDTVKKFEDIIKNNLTNKEIRDNYETKKASTKLLLADRPCSTLTTLPDDYVHYCEPRILTVREYARIQSFPDWFEIKGKYTTGGQMRKYEVPRYTQVGNASPPLFAEQCGLVLKGMLNNV
jgi:DNA (cytosine-5)-methyltransferase 1